MLVHVKKASFSVSLASWWTFSTNMAIVENQRPKLESRIYSIDLPDFLICAQREYLYPLVLELKWDCDPWSGASVVGVKALSH